MWPSQNIWTLHLISGKFQNKKSPTPLTTAVKEPFIKDLFQIKKNLTTCWQFFLCLIIGILNHFLTNPPPPSCPLDCQRILCPAPYGDRPRQHSVLLLWMTDCRVLSHIEFNDTVYVSFPCLYLISNIIIPQCRGLRSSLFSIRKASLTSSVNKHLWNRLNATPYYSIVASSNSHY